jgi:hypothetical protein
VGPSSFVGRGVLGLDTQSPDARTHEAENENRCRARLIGHRVQHMHAEQLKLSSQRWMTAALAAFSEGPEAYDFAVHHAGIAAEHLLKAYLATLHPALVVEGKDFDSLLHATGHGAHASVHVTRVKTIAGPAGQRTARVSHPPAARL